MRRERNGCARKSISSQVLAQTTGPRTPRRLDREPRSDRTTAADALAAGLWELGVRSAFGVGGGGIAPFVDALARSPIHTVHFRHETGAAFGALEAYHATGAPAVTFTTFGPGILNCLNGIAAAKREGGKLILVTCMTAPRNRGQLSVQESTAETLGGLGLFSSGFLFDFAVAVEDGAQWPSVMHALARGIADEGTFVAHLAVSASLFSAPAALPRPRTLRLSKKGVDRQALQETAELLSKGSFAVWVGQGARAHVSAVRRFVEATGAPVLSTGCGKGVVPERSPLYLGVSGLGGHARAREYLRKHKPDCMLVLGARMGELNSFWSPDYVPERAFIEVDHSLAEVGSAYPEIPCLGIQASTSEFLDQLLPLLGPGAAKLPLPTQPFPPAKRAEPTRRIRPDFLMHAIQREVVDASDALVLAEPGASLSWANQILRFDEPRYRVSLDWASMGHAAAGVVGAALASNRKVVALVGDGAMLMHGEVNTAVTHDAQAVWIVLNDACYGMVQHCMLAQGFEGTASRMAASDFAQMALAQGARGIRVTSETEVDDAVRAAMKHRGPVVVDVVVDDAIPGPYMERAASLKAQGIVGRVAVEREEVRA